MTSVKASSFDWLAGFVETAEMICSRVAASAKLLNARFDEKAQK